MACSLIHNTFGVRGHVGAPGWQINLHNQRKKVVNAS